MIPAWPGAPLPRRLLFLLGNLAAGLAIMYACVVPVSGLLADRDREIARQRLILARLQAVAARETSAQPAAKRAPVGGAEFLTGKADGAIGAELQTRLKGMVEAAGARLRSIRNLPPKSEGQIRYLGSHVEAFGTLAAIQRAVHAMESARPYLFVTGATLRHTAPVGPAGASQEPVIEAQFDVVGAMRIEEPAP
ncbi:MAG TPA: type II secretion system protein GspM [Hyphomicrobiaceae bacterium]|jgi:hypothetical protein